MAKCTSVEATLAELTPIKEAAKKKEFSATTISQLKEKFPLLKVVVKICSCLSDCCLDHNLKFIAFIYLLDFTSILFLTPIPLVKF